MTIQEAREAIAALDADLSRLPEGYLDNVLEFALRRGLLDSFVGSMTNLAHNKVTLFTDFAPYSFTFQWYLPNRSGDYEPWLFGGFIYHGAGDSGAGAPTFSVRLADREEGWSTHT